MLLYASISMARNSRHVSSWNTRESDSTRVTADRSPSRAPALRWLGTYSLPQPSIANCWDET